MRRLVAGVLAVAALGPASSSLAQDQAEPSRKPGWWEMQVAVMGPTPEPIHQTLHMCTDAAFDVRQSPFGVNMSGDRCQPMKIARSGSGWTIAGACDTGQMKITANAVATGDLNDRYHVDIDTRMDPPPTPQAASVKVAIDAHRLGECPAGKKPGDIDGLPGGGPPPASN